MEEQTAEANAMTSPVWKDARLHKPPSNGYRRYAVIFESCGIASKGFAGWMPRPCYREGDWTSVTYDNNNGVSGAQVLYWHEFLPPPAGVDLSAAETTTKKTTRPE